jgi:two-component system cell cycle response regulator
VTVSISIGLALGMPKTEPAPESVEAVLDRADRALLFAKAAGRNKVTISRSAA